MRRPASDLVQKKKASARRNSESSAVASRNILAFTVAALLFIPLVCSASWPTLCHNARHSGHPDRGRPGERHPPHHRAFKAARVCNPIQIARNGFEAIAYLSGEGKFANRAEYPLPHIVLLDLRMPGMDGYEVLSWIRQHEGIRALPVIVLTSSNLLSDVNRAYQLGANSFFVKDVDFKNTTDLVRVLKLYWIDLALTPETHRQKRNQTRM